MKTKNNLETLYNRFQGLNSHPEFRKRPYQVLLRLLLWEFFKVIRYQPIINIHNGSKMLLKPGRKRGIHGLIYIFRENYEYNVRYAVEKFISTGSICYDIGANIGLWTLRISELVEKTGCVYAFEPVSRNREFLIQNLELSGAHNNVQILPLALGNQEITSKIYIPVDPGSSSMAPETSGDQHEEIEVKRLDDIWESQGCPHVAFVKMDVEGSEPFILEGGSKFFREIRPVVVCEVNSRKLNAMGKNMNDIYDKFSEWGYNSLFFDWKTKALSKLNSRQDGDIIFIPNSEL